MKTAPRLALRLLGGFVLERDRVSCKIAYEKGRGLLAYLALEPGRTHQRTALAAMFWPDLTHDAALSNLRLVLHNLRQTLASPGADSPALHVDRENVRLDPVPALSIDTADFFIQDPKCPSPPAVAVCTPCLGHMELVAGLYRGEFMAGFSLPDCPDFEAWLQVRREATHMRALTLLARLADCHERMGNYAQSLPFALRFLELEPWNEDALRRAMRLYALNGQQAAALAQCETSCRGLKRDLGIAPSEETRALAARIREGELSPTTRRRGDSPPPADAPLPIAEKRQVTSCRRSTPRIPTSRSPCSRRRRPAAANSFAATPAFWCKSVAAACWPISATRRRAKTPPALEFRRHWRYRAPALPDSRCAPRYIRAWSSAATCKFRTR